MSLELSIVDIIKDRLLVTVDKLEALRPGVTDRAIAEAQVELNLETVTAELQKLQVGLAAALKLCRSALDLYIEELKQEQADDVLREYSDRIEFLKIKLAELQTEFASVTATVSGDPDITPPCFDIKKAGTE